MANLIGKLFEYTAKIASAPIKVGGKGIWETAKKARGSFSAKSTLKESLNASASVIKEDISGLTSYTDKITDMFRGSLSKGTSIGRGFVGAKKSLLGGKVGWAVKGLGKGVTSTPALATMFGVSVIGGGIYGTGSAIMQRADQRTQMISGRGMAPNNLGTDGLTLALSRRRHRG